jgi:hypothetical protein
LHAIDTSVENKPIHSNNWIDPIPRIVCGNHHHHHHQLRWPLSPLGNANQSATNFIWPHLVAQFAKLTHRFKTKNTANCSVRQRKERETAKVANGAVDFHSNNHFWREFTYFNLLRHGP